MKVNLGKFPKTSDRRKVDIQIDNYDTWNVDHTLAMIVLPLLLQLKVTKMGVPAEFADVSGADYDMQDSFDFVKEDHNWAFEQKCKEWETILDKMIWSFLQIVTDDWEEKYHYGKPEYDWVKTDEKITNPLNGKPEETFQMVDKNPGEHWTDFEGMRLHNERIQEGLDLFGKYYQHLWD